jgi:hypothetical protein
VEVVHASVGASRSVVHPRECLMMARSEWESLETLYGGGCVADDWVESLLEDAFEDDVASGVSRESIACSLSRI